MTYFFPSGNLLSIKLKRTYLCSMLSVIFPFKGNDSETDFSIFLYKSVRHRSLRTLTQLLQPFPIFDSKNEGCVRELYRTYLYKKSKKRSHCHVPVRLEQFQKDFSKFFVESFYIYS
jgi:hypothetical protein